MTTWTSTSRSKLKWQAPETTSSSEAYELEIGGGFLLDLGTGTELTIQTEDAPTVWTTTTKENKLLWPQTVIETEYSIEIGDGFDLEIGDGFILSNGTNARNETVWSSIGKTGRL